MDTIIHLLSGPGPLHIDQDSLSVICSFFDIKSRAHFELVCKQWHQAACRSTAWEGLPSLEPRGNQLALLVRMFTSRSICPSALNVSLEFTEPADLLPLFSLTGLVKLELCCSSCENASLVQSNLHQLQQLQELELYSDEKELRHDGRTIFCFPRLTRLRTALLFGFYSVDGLDNLPLLSDLTLHDTQYPPKAWPPALQSLTVDLLPPCELVPDHHWETPDNIAMSSSIVRIHTLTSLCVDFEFRLAQSPTLLSSLTHVSLTSDSETIHHLSTLHTQIRHLDLHNSPDQIAMPQSVLDTLPTFTSLVELHFSTRRPGHNALSFLRSLVNLEVLYIFDGTEIDSERVVVDLSPIGALSKLRKLDVFLVTVDSLSFLQHCTRLEELTLWACWPEFDDDRLRIISLLPLLTRLSVRKRYGQNCTSSVSSAGVSSLCSLSKLEYLYLFCVGSYEQIMPYIARWPRLRAMGLASKPSATQEKELRDMLPRFEGFVSM